MAQKNTKASTQDVQEDPQANTVAPTSVENVATQFDESELNDLKEVEAADVDVVASQDYIAVGNTLKSSDGALIVTNGGKGYQREKNGVLEIGVNIPKFVAPQERAFRYADKDNVLSKDAYDKAVRKLHKAHIKEVSESVALTCAIYLKDLGYKKPFPVAEDFAKIA